MSFQAYLGTILAQTGPFSDDLTQDDLRAYAVWQGYLDEGAFRPDIMIGTVMADLKRDFDLTPIQAMAVYARLRGFRPDSEH